MTEHPSIYQPRPELTDQEKADKAWAWASSLDTKTLHWAVYTMSVSTDAFTPAERKALLQVATMFISKHMEGN